MTILRGRTELPLEQAEDDFEYEVYGFADRDTLTLTYQEGLWSEALYVVRLRRVRQSKP